MRIDDHPLLKIFLFLLLDVHLLEIQLGIVRILFPSFLLLLVAAPEAEGVVAEAWRDTEHHVAGVEHVRRVHLRALLHVDFLRGETVQIFKMLFTINTHS